MALRPGNRLEISSHFIPLPLSSMIRASSSGDHLLCFLTGWSDAWGGMLRLLLVICKVVAEGGRARAAGLVETADTLIGVG